MKESSLQTPSPVIRLERERRTKRPVLSPAEEKLLLPAASPHLREIAIIALDTGMRRGEILHQTWDDVDFDRGLLSITHSKTPEGEAREIPLPRRVQTLLSKNTRLMELGVTREVRMALLGHTFGDTHESYEHVELPLKRQAIKKLDAWLESNHAVIEEEIHGPRTPQAIDGGSRAGRVN